MLSLLGHEKSLQTILITLEGKTSLVYSSVARMQGKQNCSFYIFVQGHAT
jgi:hypothetical protein